MSSRPRLGLWLLLAFVVVAIDQLSKQWVVNVFDLGYSEPITPFFNLVRAHNTGAAFSFLADAAGWQRWFFTVLGIGASAFIVWLLRSPDGQPLFRFALTMILGGAIGNVIDRLRHGHVVDFIQLHAGGSYFPAFNLADSAITLGAVLLIVDELRRVRDNRRTP